MVRLLLSGALVLWAAAAAAQESAVPPVVPDMPPVPGESVAGTEALPRLPGIAASPAGVIPDGSAIAELPPTAVPIETDLVALVKKAHPVVQAVMALLVLNVFTVLTIYLFKAVEFALAFARLRREMREILAGPGLPGASGTGPLAQSARAARAEVEALPPRITPDLRHSARERLDISLARIEAGVVRDLRAGSGVLASIGSLAPFVGLFGTVYGIMNSFLAIAASQTTNLSVVAPGIAEALLATGIGLAAAIPAVMIYNRTLRRIAEFRHRLADGTAEILRRFSLAMDARMGGEALHGLAA